MPAGTDLPKPPADWRERILAALPEQGVEGFMLSTRTLNAAIAVAAYNRRMPPQAYVMRAARAFVAYDLDRDLRAMAEHEPPFAHTLTPDLERRYRGLEFGQWRIERLGDV